MKWLILMQISASGDHKNPYYTLLNSADIKEVKCGNKIPIISFSANITRTRRRISKAPKTFSQGDQGPQGKSSTHYHYFATWSAWLTAFSPTSFVYLDILRLQSSCVRKKYCPSQMSRVMVVAWTETISPTLCVGAELTASDEQQLNLFLGTGLPPTYMY